VHVEFRTVNLLDDPVVRGVILSGHDVTQLVEARETLKHLASHDTLTGLANRASLADYLGHLLADEAMAEQTAVVFIDLDRFKPVNDLYGHDVGDRLLVEVAARLREVVRPTDLVARFGGDEFVVVATNLPNLGSVAALAARIERGLNGAVALGRASVPVQVSIGYALARAGATAGTLIGEADAAMYAVKEARRGASPTAVAESQSWVAGELPRAIEDRQLVVHFQPVVAVADGRIAGYEALVRWDHPTRGMLEPGLFLPVAEEIGVAPALGDRVLEAAVRFISQCNERVVEPRWVSVNLTASQFHDPLLPAMIRRHVMAAGLDPGLLRLEVSEAMALDRVEQGTSTSTESSISSLEQLGVRLVLDDFGTGYASLLQLCRLPAVALKIDRTFVTGLSPDRPDDVVASMIQIGEVLGLEVVAEGVERAEQLDALAALGCPFAQGFLLGRPGPSPLPT
jgi:diguanylate cyclase (GGDEF)-like protein